MSLSSRQQYNDHHSPGDSAPAYKDKDSIELSELEGSRTTSPLLAYPTSRMLRPRSSLLKTLCLIVGALTVGLIIGAWSQPTIPEWALKYIRVYGTVPERYKDWRSHRPQIDPTKYEMPLPNVSICNAVSNGILATLRHSDKAEVTVVTANGEILPYGGEIEAPAALCILYTLPQAPVQDDLYSDVPIPGKGPDTVHMYINGSDVILTYPPLRPLPNQPQAERQITDLTVTYYAEATLYNAGVYETVAEREFTNWRWAQEWSMEPKKPVFHYRGGYDLPIDVVQNYQFDPENLPWAVINVTGPRHLPARPPCSASVTAAEGRWYKQQKFPILDSELVDEWGYGWQGDKCHLEYFTPAETVECFENKTIHFYGDSMTRRLAKSIMSAGKWCLDPLSKCQDEDDRDYVPVPRVRVDATGGLIAEEFTRGEHFQFGDNSSIEFGRNSSLYFSFLSSLTNSTMNWMIPLYDEQDLIVPEEEGDKNYGLKAGARSRPPPAMKPADVVILGLGAWDQAFTNKFSEFEARLKDFRDAFLHAYPHTPTIMRMSNSWCCRGTPNGFRRYTGGRIQQFDDIVRDVFNVTGATGLDGKMLVMDPSNMNGRPDVIFDYGASNANHPRASHVRMEMQMMMNSLCRKDPKTGKVSMNMDFASSP